MSNELKRLELTWIGKDKKINPEPRILLYDKANSYGDQSTENLLIHGDNLLALKALELDYTGKIKCIYIDPPYNTGSAFEHYDDNLEHSTWLSLVRPRLELLRNLLSDDGSIWISIDDDEGHYLKVLCDEVFGRSNFINTVIWEKKYAPQNDAKWLSDSHDFILVYARNKDRWRPNLLPRTNEMNERYKNPDNDPRGPWKSSDLSVKTYNANCDYPITTPSGRVVEPPESRCWSVNITRFEELVADNRIWFGKDGNSVPSVKRFITDVKQGTVSMTLWKYTDVGHNQDAKREVTVFNNDSPFATPKPERLIERVLTLATNPGDLILDSFLGSGTTAAVAHKMNRRYIGIELGNHCYTHCVPRLKAVIDGEQGGISKAVNWQGGGGYRFMKLAETLLTTDKYGHLIINPQYNAEMLAAAMAKHRGYRYNPDQHSFWKQGHQGTNNFIYTTTMFITPEYLDLINIEMAENEHLLICCEAFTKDCNKRHKRISVQKIPKILLGRCEFGKDSYDLNIVLQDSGDWAEEDE